MPRALAGVRPRSDREQIAGHDHALHLARPLADPADTHLAVPALERQILGHANAAMDCELLVFASEQDERSLAAIDTADAVLVFTRRMHTAGIELERFQQYCRDGRPIVGVRTASHAWQNWLEFDREVLGGNYEGHFGSGVTTKVEFAAESAEHPILQDIEAFDAHGSLYQNTPIAEDTQLLATGEEGQHREPAAWTCDRAGRAFYTSLGHQHDFWELDFLRLVRNGLLWSLN